MHYTNEQGYNHGLKHALSQTLRKALGTYLSTIAMPISIHNVQGNNES